MQHKILDLLPSADRAAVRLVARNWALAPLHSGFAHNGTACSKLLKCIQGPDAVKRWRPRPFLRFDNVRHLELCTGGDNLPDHLAAALASPACSGIESITIGGIFRQERSLRNERLLAALAGSGVRRLTFGSARAAAAAPATHASGKLWVSGTLNLGMGDGFEQLETVTALATDVHCPAFLRLGGNLPSLRTVHLTNLGGISISDKLPPEAVILVPTAPHRWINIMVYSGDQWHGEARTPHVSLLSVSTRFTVGELIAQYSERYNR